MKLSTLERIGNAFNAAMDTARGINDANRDYDNAKSSYEFEMQKMQIQFDRAVATTQFDTAQKGINNELYSSNGYFDKMNESKDYNSYQQWWDEKYNAIMNADYLVTNYGMSKENAERFIAERGNQIKTQGNDEVRLRRMSSSYEQVATNLSAFYNLQAKGTENLSDAIKESQRRYEEVGGAGIDTFGTLNPTSEENLYAMASEHFDTYGKKLIEQSITDPSLSFDEALEQAYELFDKDMGAVNAQSPAIQAEMASQREAIATSMYSYWQKQSIVANQISNAKAEPVNAIISEAKKNGTVIDANTLQTAMKNSKLDPERFKTDKAVCDAIEANVDAYNKSVYSDILSNLSQSLLKSSNERTNIDDYDKYLEGIGITKDMPIYDTALDAVIETEQSIRKGEETSASLIAEGSKAEILSMIASGEYASENPIVYGHEGVIDESKLGDNTSLSHSISEGFYTITAKDGSTYPYIQTSYSSIVDEICKKYDITDPDQQMLIASKVNEYALELNAEDTSEPGDPDGGLNASEQALMAMCTDTNAYSSRDVEAMYNQMDMEGLLSAEFKRKWSSTYFGKDGNKRESVFMDKANSDVANFRSRLAQLTSNDVAEGILYDMSKNGNVVYQFEEIERMNPNMTDEERTRMIDEMINVFASADVAKQIDEYVDSAYKYANGNTEKVPLESMQSVADVYNNVTDGTWNYLIDNEAVSIAKQKLYSDSASSYTQKEMENTLISSISNGRYATMDALDKDKSIGDSEKDAYKSKVSVNAAYIVQDVSMYKKAEDFARKLSGGYNATKGVGKGLQELHIKDIGNAVMDDSGLVYVAHGNNAIDIYYLDPSSSAYKRANGSSTASVMPTELKAGGTYSLETAKVTTKEYKRNGYPQTDRYLEDYLESQSESDSDKPEKGSTEYLANGGNQYSDWHDKQQSKKSNITKSDGSYIIRTTKTKKKTESEIQYDPALWSIIESLIQ